MVSRLGVLRGYSGLRHRSGDEDLCERPPSRTRLRSCLERSAGEGRNAVGRMQLLRHVRSAGTVFIG